MRKLSMAVGFAAGYVLGARAGRQRYEQITQVAHKVWEHPTVQSAAGVVGAQASEFVGRARGKALSALHLGHDDATAHETETTAYAGRSSANGSLP